MNLEIVIQSELIQKMKNKYYILTHIFEIQKNDIDHLICKTELKTHVENKYKDIKVGKGGWNELGDED